VQDLLGYFDEIVKGFLEHSKEAFKLPDAAVTRLDQVIVRFSGRTRTECVVLR